MLEKLETLYGKKSDVSVEGQQKLFFDYKYIILNKSAIENYMMSQQFAEDLTTEGVEIKESWIMTRILEMLPSKLHHFCTAWDNASATDKNLSNLFERLRMEEDRLNDSESSELLFFIHFDQQRVLQQ